jgi:hypothetical protein
MGREKDVGICLMSMTSTLLKCRDIPYQVKQKATVWPLFLSLQVAAALLGASLPSGNCQARIVSFIGGPCTEGAGKVVNRELTEEMRSHKVSEGR